MKILSETICFTGVMAKEVLVFNYSLSSHFQIRNHVIGYKANKENWSKHLVGRWKIKQKKINGAHF